MASILASREEIGIQHQMTRIFLLLFWLCLFGKMPKNLKTVSGQNVPGQNVPGQNVSNFGNICQNVSGLYHSLPIPSARNDDRLITRFHGSATGMHMLWRCGTMSRVRIRWFTDDAFGLSKRAKSRTGGETGHIGPKIKLFFYNFYLFICFTLSHTWFICIYQFAFL